MTHSDEYYGGPDEITSGTARQEAPLLGYTVVSGRAVPLSKVMDMEQAPAELPGYLRRRCGCTHSDVMEVI